MAARRSVVENARRSLIRQRREQTLVCPECLTQNKPGSGLIELDDTDTAWCSKCGNAFAVLVEYDA